MVGQAIYQRTQDSSAILVSGLLRSAPGSRVCGRCYCGYEKKLVAAAIYKTDEGRRAVVQLTLVKP